MKNNEFEYEKSIIGYLIKFYRSKIGMNILTFLKNEKEYYNSYCLECSKCKNKSIICSTRTLYKIENGFCSKNECIYYRLSENVGKYFQLEEDILNKLDFYQNYIYQNLVNLSCTSLRKIKKKLDDDLIKYNNIIYVSERISLYNDLIEYKLNRKSPPKEKIELYIFLKDHIGGVDKKLILLLLYNLSFVRFNNFSINRKDIEEDCIDDLDEPLFLRIRLSATISHDLIKGYDLLINIEEKCKDKFNLYQRYILYEYFAFLYINLGLNEKSYEAINSCLEIIENESTDFDIYTKNNCYRQAGIICYLLNNFELSSEYFMKILSKSNISSIGINYALLFSALEKINKKESIIKIIKEIDFLKIKNKNEKNIIIYFKKKYFEDINNKSTINELEDIICDEMTNIIRLGGEIYLNIFKDELMKFLPITTNYKKLYLFEKSINSK